MKLLLVDDEPMVLGLLEECVEEVLPMEEQHAFTSASEAMEFAQTTRIDVAFLDINMRVMNGVEMAKRLQQLNEKVNIIFCTGYSEYMQDAFEMYCSGYLMKPITADKIRSSMAHLRYPVDGRNCKVYFQCFGNFEAFYEGKVISFQYKRTKELLAYLVDRQGANVSMNEIDAVMFEEGNHTSYLRNLRKDLLDTFEGLGEPEVVRSGKGWIGIDREKVRCDYFDYLEGSRENPPAEYMSQYSFGEVTLAGLAGGL